MSTTVCRTCLMVFKENSHEFFTLENRASGITTFREKLICCIPELALDIIPNAVICTACSTTLNLAYSFKTKCLETETKVRKYLFNFNDGCNVKTQWFTDFNSNNSDKSILEPSKIPSVEIKQEQGFFDSSDTVSMDSENIKSEVEYFEDKCNSETSEDPTIQPNGACCNETSTNSNYFCGITAKDFGAKKEFVNCTLPPTKQFLKNTKDIAHDGENKEKPDIKIEDDASEELKFISRNYNFNYEAQQPQSYYNYFTRALQKLQDNNMNAGYQRALQQFNLLKVVKSLATQGTEINIKGLGISHQNKVSNETAKQFAETPQNFIVSIPDYDEKSLYQSKQKKTLYERYDCYYCDRSFDRLSLLKTHTISHTGVKPFTCNICGKGCSHKGELNNHVRTHTGEKPFKCSLCEASFSQISNMKIHMRTHTGEKPYKCDYCEKTFSHKCGVKVHMRTHTGERPYKCEVCFKTYTHKKDLDDHMRTHTGEKYRCTICLKEITYKKNLSAHMVTHSGKNATNLGVLKSNVTRLLAFQNGTLIRGTK